VLVKPVEDCYIDVCYTLFFMKSTAASNIIILHVMSQQSFENNWLVTALVTSTKLRYV